jgi:UMF1 family MFS transporter
VFRNWNRTELSWAFYDWANSAYALIVMTAFFPLLLGHYAKISDLGMTATSVLGFANSAASAAVVVLAPVLGALGDQYGAKRKLLGAFALLGVLACFSLGLVERGQPLLAALVFACGNIGFAAANGLYDALIVEVTGGERFDRLSAFGFSLGYAGSLLLFLFSIAMTMQPDWFGFADPIAAIRLAFALVAIWWLVFTIPLLTAVVDEQPLADPGSSAWRHARAAFGELWATLHEVRRYRRAAIFLLAYFLYMDGVYTVIKMAVVYATELNFSSQVQMIGIVIVQVVAIPATLAYGRLAERFGARRMIMLGIVAYIVVISAAPQMSRPEHFYGLALLIGLAQGGLQSVSRSLYARLIPAAESGKYFGFYNMVGKFATVLGPFLMAVTALSLGTRYSILAIPVLLAAGLMLLFFLGDD